MKKQVKNEERKDILSPQKNRKAKIGIKLKLLGILLPMVIAVVAVIVAQVYSHTKQILLSKSEENLSISTQSVVHQVETWMKETITALKTERDAIEFFAPGDDQELAYIKHTADRFAAFPAGIYLATTEGTLLHASFVPDDSFNVFEKPWYQDGLVSEEFIFGSVYFDEDSQSYVVGASGMLKDQNGNCRGVAAADIYLNAISDIVKEVQLEDTGKMFLVDSNTGMIIGHPEEALVGVQLEEQENQLYAYVNGRINTNETGLGTVTMANGERIYVDIQKVPDSAWITVAYVPQTEILSELNGLTVRIVAIAVIGCLFLVILMERMIHIIVKPVKKLNNTIKVITDGDFTASVPVRTSDEIGNMAEAVREFIQTMRSVIKQISQVSEVLNSQADESRSMSAELSGAADRQAVSMNEMTRTVSELTVSIAEVAGSATSLSLLVTDTREKGDMAGEQMKQAVAASDSGKADMQRVIGSMEHISGRMDSLESCARQMDGSIEKINAIVGMIGDIAEETNLLSLNASIEAARAGEAGRGFAVVADQIGKLAATSKASVDEIASLTAEISGIVRQTVQETTESSDVIRESSGIVQEAGRTFDQIYQSVEATSEAVDHMIEKIREVSEIAHSVAAITEEQSAASEEILATTETVNENTVRVSENSIDVEHSAGKLENSAKLLSEEMTKFKV